MASRNLKNGFYMHFLVIEGASNIVVVNIAAFDISLLLARTSIFVSQKLVRSQFLVLVWILTAFIPRCGRRLILAGINRVCKYVT